MKLVTDQVPESALLYHVGQEMFLTKGTTWGNHAALTKDVSAAFLYEFQLQADTEGVYKLHCAQAKNTGYLGRNSETELYTDYNNKTGWSVLFSFVKNESGYYHIITAPDCPTFGSKIFPEGTTNYGLYEMGWNPDNDDVDKDGNSLGTNVGIFMLDPTLSGVQLDWAFLPQENYTLYQAQQNLYKKLNEGVAAGLTEDELAAYAALLASNNAEEINAATAAVADKILNYAYDHATLENPFDITDKITNPTFEGAVNTVANGWTDEFDNMHIQNNKAYFLWDDENNEETTEYGLNNFAQNWTASATDPIAQSNIYQVLSELPQGVYRVTADAVATSGSANLIVSGAQLYAKSGAVTYATDIDKNPYGESGSSNPHRYTVDVTHFGGDMTIGYGFTPGYVKWFAVDNFRLLYCGPVDNPGLIALQSTYANAQKYAEGYNDLYIYSEATNAALSKELENAEAIMAEGNSEACTAETEKLNAMVIDIQHEISSYNVLYALIAKINEDKNSFANIPSLIGGLEDMADEYNAAYEERTASVEQITAWAEGYNAFILNGVKDAMAYASEENPVDITIMAKNMDFATNSTTEGWLVEVGSVTDGGAYKVNNHNAEVWQNSFTATQSVENLPSGKYILKANAFFRTGSNAEGYDAYVNGTGVVSTYLFMGESTAPVVNHAAGAATGALHSGYAETAEGSGIWLPNSQAAAEYAFNNSDVYNCEVSGYMPLDGTLSFGVRNTEVTEANNCWSVWTDMRLIYCGKSNNALYNSMNEAKENAIIKMEEVGMMIEAAYNKLEAAIAQADNLTDKDSEESIMAALVALNDAIAYANEGLAMVSDLLDAYLTYTDKLGSFTSSDTRFPAMMEELSEAMGAEEFKSNEKMKEWLEQLPIAWTAYIQYDHLGATKDAPEDISAVINNPSFDQGTNDTNGATGWTFTYETSKGHIGWNNTDQQSGSGYAYEFWAVSNFEMSQTIVGLAEGYYRLSANALYRAGDNGDAAVQAFLTNPESVADMSMYANAITIKIVNAYADVAAEDAGNEVAVTMNGETKYVPNSMIAAGNAFNAGRYTNTLDVFLKQGESLTIGMRIDGNNVENNWSVFDNFKLEYLGNGEENMPDAIQGVEANSNAEVKIYDITGRQVSKAVKGIYIINGKKVLVK